MKNKNLMSSVSNNILISSKLWSLITKYKRYKKLAEIFDGDDNNIAHYNYYYHAMQEAQYDAYQLICATGNFDLMILVDM